MLRLDKCSAINSLGIFLLLQLMLLLFKIGSLLFAHFHYDIKHDYVGTRCVYNALVY